MEETSQFSKLRGIFFPIYAYELKKIVPLACILFFSLFNHYCLKNIKDSLVVTAVGAEAIAFIKLFLVPPAAILFMLVYTKVSDRLKNEHLYYATLGSFVSFFVLFVLVLYPLKNYVCPSADSIARFQTQFPSCGLAFAIIGVWPYALFFIFAELWSTFILSLSFWQFMNQITELQEAKRIYGVLLLLGQGAVTISGGVGFIASNIREKVSCVDPWQITLYWLIGSVTVTSILSMCIYHWIYRHVLTDKRFYNKPELPGFHVKDKKKSSLWNSLKVVVRSHYVRLLIFLVFCYSVCDNILENFWKHAVKVLYPNINDYNTFMSMYTFIYGVLSMGVVLITGYIFRRFQWGVGAMLTPMVVLVGGVCLFLSFLGEQFLSGSVGMVAGIQTTIVYVGLITLVLDKGFKMSFFDMSKEMAFIPLDDELKVKGKAITDVFGYRFGKSFGSGLQVILLSLVSALSGVKATYESIAIYAFVVFLTCATVWVISVFRLNRKIQRNRELS